MGRFDPILGQIEDLSELVTDIAHAQYELPAGADGWGDSAFFRNFDFKNLRYESTRNGFSMNSYRYPGGDNSFMQVEHLIGFYRVKLLHGMQCSLTEKAVNAFKMYSMEGGIGGIQIERRTDDKSLANIHISDGTVVSRILATIPIANLPTPEEIFANTRWAESVKNKTPAPKI